MFQKKLGAAGEPGYHPGWSNLSAEAAAQKTLKQRMQTKFFATRVAGYCHENVSAHECRQGGGAADRREKARAGFHVDSIQQGNASEELPHLWRLSGEHLFGEVLEDIAL